MPPVWADSWKKNTLRYDLDDPRKGEWLTIDFFRAFHKKWICTHISLVEIKIIIIIVIMIIVIMKTIIKSSKTIIIIIVYNVTVMGLNMNGPLDHWTIFLDYFLDHFLDLFFYPIFFWIILWLGGGREHTISTQGVVGCSQSVLREWWEADCYYFGRGGRRTIST